MASSSSGGFDDFPHDKRIIIYPVMSHRARITHHAIHEARVVAQIYLNSKASIPDGRRLPLKFCVENPTLQEIQDVLQHLEIEFALEVAAMHPLLPAHRPSHSCAPQDKTYPRDSFQRGRLRVALKDLVSGEPKVPDIGTRAFVAPRPRLPPLGLPSALFCRKIAAAEDRRDDPKPQVTEGGQGRERPVSPGSGRHDVC